jgi:D-glycero-alpha-D-manno-heptose-7-phosphate kinase
MVTFRARAPLRLGLAGGGTDLAAYADLYGGVVLNATIDRYASVHLTPRTDGRLVLRADDIGKAEELPADIDLPIREGLILHRAVWRHFMLAYNGGMPMGLTIATNNDVPAGSGLGASSALVVALIEAFALLFEAPLGPYDIAQLAYDIERVQLGLLGGKQDQYAAAFGGINYIEFLRQSAGVVVNPLRIRRDIINEFESSLVICFSGQSRESAEIIAEQVGGLEKMDDGKIAAMHRIKQSAMTMKGRLLSGDLRGMAHELHAAWEAKKSTAKSISNAHVDTLLEVALDAGAWAGKISGAGGGGFIFIMSDPADRFQIIQRLNQAGGNASSVNLTFSGVEGWKVRTDAVSRDALIGPN